MLGFGGSRKAGRGPIGIAVTAGGVYLAQRGTRQGDLFAVEPLPEGLDPSSPSYHTEVSRAISAATRKHRFMGKQAVSALPPESLMVKTLRLPPMPAEDLVQAVAWEASERFQVGDGQAIQFYHAGDVQQGREKRQEIILLSAESATVNDHTLAVKRAGLMPTAIDATAAALARLLGQAKGSTLIVDLGRTGGEIVGARGTQVVFSKPIEVNRLNDQLDTTGLTRELSLCLRYLSVTFGIHTPESAWLSGLGATPKLAAKLSENLNLQLLHIGQSPALQGIALPGSDPAPWLVPLGLSLRDTTRGIKRGAA